MDLTWTGALISPWLNAPAVFPVSSPSCSTQQLVDTDYQEMYLHILISVVNNSCVRSETGGRSGAVVAGHTDSSPALCRDLLHPCSPFEDSSLCWWVPLGSASHLPSQRGACQSDGHWQSGRAD